MNAYLPQDIAVLWKLAGLFAAMLLVGRTICFVRSLTKARFAAWFLTGAGTLLVDRFTAAEPAGLRMVSLVIAMLWGMKTIVMVEYLAGGKPPLGAARWLGFTTLWFGMRPAIFAAEPRPALPGAWRSIGTGVLKGLAGLGLFVMAGLIWHQLPTGTSLSVRWLATLPALGSLSLMLHFGIFPVAVGLWRLAGVDARPLFRSPIGSRSLTEFWGQRWNVGFSEMTAVAVYRPLADRLGKTVAMTAAFLFSGVLHEGAISIPVRAGYGLPLAYFALHAGLMLVERWLENAGHGVEQWGLAGRAWTLFWLVIPLPLLFHVWFVQGTVWPLFE